MDAERDMIQEIYQPKVNMLHEPESLLEISWLLRTRCPVEAPVVTFENCQMSEDV